MHPAAALIIFIEVDLRSSRRYGEHVDLRSMEGEGVG
jgi:hypothetical protein